MSDNQNLGSVPDTVAEIETVITDIIRDVDAALTEDLILVTTAGGTFTLTSAQATRIGVLKLTGTPAAAITVEIPATHALPATLKKFISISNASGKVATIQVVGGAGLTIDVDPASNAMIYTDGADVYAMAGGTGGGATAPTRTSVTLSGISTSQAIPANCTHFRYVSGDITMSVGGDELLVQLFHTGDTVARTLDVMQAAMSTSAVTAFTAATDLINTVSDESISTSRSVAGNVTSPRDGAKKTLVNGWGYNFGGANTIRQRDGVAVAATDDDTIRFVAESGTLSGAVEIEWFYN